MLKGDLPEPQNSGHKPGPVVSLPGPRHTYPELQGDTWREGIPPTPHRMEPCGLAGVQGVEPETCWPPP